MKIIFLGTNGWYATDLGNTTSILICSDELEICGGYISGKITDKKIEKAEVLFTTPDLTALFDAQYNKGIGFKNEKYMNEKKSGKYIFW